MSVVYRQCQLERRQGASTLRTTSWLPDVFAVLGDFLRLRQPDGSWSDGWQVTFVSQASLSESLLRKVERAHLKQRKASDI